MLALDTYETVFHDNAEKTGTLTYNSLQMKAMIHDHRLKRTYLKISNFISIYSPNAKLIVFWSILRDTVK